MIDRLHIGCGSRFLRGWINADKRPNSAAVARLDVTEPFPFSDDSFDNVFCEHLFEHLTMDEAARCAAEVRRILRNRGIFRIVVPDAILRPNPEKFPNEHEHVTAWTYISMRWLLSNANFSKIEFVRYYDVDLALHLDVNLLNNEERGPIYRQESLIVDAIK